MSRYCEQDDYEGEPEQILALGRWENNARRALKSKRGRRALAEIRDALLALPDKRLISGAMCTVGGLDRIPDPASPEIAAREAAVIAEQITQGTSPEVAKIVAAAPRWDLEDDRDRLRDEVSRQGTGVCAMGALLWHRKVQAGTDPAEAFAQLPTLVSADDGDALGKTASIAAKEAGLAYTLAWELAYRNDETYERKTPEERYAAFLEWIDAELAESAAA